MHNEIDAARGLLEGGGVIEVPIGKFNLKLAQPGQISVRADQRADAISLLHKSFSRVTPDKARRSGDQTALGHGMYPWFSPLFARCYANGSQNDWHAKSVCHDGLGRLARDFS